MVFVYLEGAYTFGSAVSSAYHLFLFLYSFLKNKCTIPADFVSQI